MSRSATIRLIAWREISERIQGRFTRVMTILTVLLVVAGIAVPSLIKSGGSSGGSSGGGSAAGGNSAPTRIALVGPEAQALAPTLAGTAQAANVKVKLTDVADDQRLIVSELKAGRLDVAMGFHLATLEVAVKQSLDPGVRAVIQSAIDEARLRSALKQAGIAGIAVDKVLPAAAPVPIAVLVAQSSSPTSSDHTARVVAAIVAALLMYVSLGLYGQAVAAGVAQEKTSRTAEVLLAAVRPRELLAGKVIGIGLTGLGQLAIAATAGLIANAAIHSAKIPSSIWGLLPGFLVCFLAGFMLYAFAYAAAGALVARQEEVQSAIVPIAMPLLIGYLLVYAAAGSPNATWVKVASFVPLLTATLMPARIALGHVAWWEFVLAAVIMSASIYAMAGVAARVYERSLLRSGGRISWRAALREAG
jgi:ABC-2 type transport system permease protein